jgi:methylated-DNA-[protein]-cysteine S-methyltransferase
MRDLMVFDGLYRSPVGWLGFIMTDDRLAHLDWLGTTLPAGRLRRHSPQTRKIARCLDSYFRSPHKAPEPLLSPHGTDFQLRVWRALQQIPSGTVKTYGELAEELKTGSRAVGQACRGNPISIFIPCHRVVAADGVGGFMGKAGKTEIKQWLLRHEGAH